MKVHGKRTAKQSYFTKQYHSPGTPPGTLTNDIAESLETLSVKLVDYSFKDVVVKENAAVSECIQYLNKDTITWVHVQGSFAIKTLQALGEAFHLHPLAMEDVLNTGQRPKIEPFEHQLFMVLSLPHFEDEMITIRQVSVFASERYIISFCEGEGDPFDPIVQRLQNKTSVLRKCGADFLLYAIMDLTIDAAFPVLEAFGLQLEDMEDRIAESAGAESLSRMHVVKREMILLRRMLWPQRELVSQLLREKYDFVQEDTLIYLRDCYDHTVQIMDLLETYRDMAGSMLDIYLSSVSNRMNETMRVLAVISTIFIPMTFVAGVFGMNFDREQPLNMPELGWAYGYPIFWMLMLLIAAGMVVFFKKRGWF